MKHLEYYGVNNFKLKEVEIPQCKPNDVLIKVVSVGLCGSDIQKFLKQEPMTNYLKTKVLGHEVYGIVYSCGSNVKHLKKFQQVVVNPFSCPPKCKCTCSDYGICEKVNIIGRNIDGGYSEYICVDKNCVYNATGLTYKQGIFIDDVAVALHGLNISKNFTRDVENIAIIGDGPLGILIYRLSKVLYKKCNIILIAKNIDKIKHLEDVECVTFNKANNYDAYDIVFEVVGGAQSETLDLAINLAKPNGFIGVYGVYPFLYKPEINIRNAFYKQLTIKGFNSFSKANNDFKKALTLVKNKSIQVEDLVTYVENFNNIEEFLQNYQSNKSKKIKAVFTFD